MNYIQMSVLVGIFTGMFLNYYATQLSDLPQWFYIMGFTYTTFTVSTLMEGFILLHYEIVKSKNMDT